MNLTPLADRVVVRPDPIPTQTASGIQIVEDWPQENTGIVVSLGGQTVDVAVGDHVLFAPSAGQVMTINDERLFVMRERDVIAILESAV